MPGRWRFLKHLLMAALHRAVALEQVHDVAVRVGEDLDFDVARPQQVLLDQHPVVAEAGCGFALAGSKRLRKICAAFDDAHALAAAAGAGLDQDRIADRVGLLLQERRVLVVAVVARHERDASLLHQLLRGRFGAHGADRLDGRPDEHDALSAQAEAKSSFSDRNP